MFKRFIPYIRQCSIKNRFAFVLILILLIIVLDSFVKVFLVFPLGLERNKADISDYYAAEYDDPFSNELVDFFPKIAELEDGEVISFYHRDQRWRSYNLFKLNYPSIWCLDIQYTYEEYNARKVAIFNEIASPPEAEIGERGSFSGFLIADNRTDMYDTAKCIYFDDSSYIIRYVFIYRTYRNNKEPFSADSVHQAITTHADVPWTIVN